MKDKKQKVEEGLNDILSKQEDSSQVEGLLNRLTDIDRSIPDRLRVVCETIKGLRSEVEDLSGLLEYHSSFRLAQVIDLLNKAEDLTGEAELLTTGQGERFQVWENDYDNSWDINDNYFGVGIRLKKWNGKTPSKYLLMLSAQRMANPHDELVEKCVQDLVSFAREKFPREFGLKK